MQTPSKLQSSIIQSLLFSCNKRFLVESYRNASKHYNALGSRSELLIPYTSQAFLRSSNTNLVKKVIKAFLSADIFFLYKLNSKHKESLFRGIGHNLPSEGTCRKTMQRLSEDELQRIRITIQVYTTNEYFWLLMRALYLGIQYLTILRGSLQTPHVKYFFVCQPLPCEPNSNSIAQAADDAVRSL